MKIFRATTRLLRPRSVRAKIVALLMLPIVSLMALWSYAAVTTVAAIGDTERAKDVNSELLAPVATFVTTLQSERTAAMRYAARRTETGLDDLRADQQATDKAVTALRAGLSSSSSDAALIDTGLPDRLRTLEADFSDLAALRAGTTGPGARDAVSTAYTKYSTVIDHAFAVTGALTSEKGTDATSEARVVLELSRVRDAVAREQALLAAATASGTLGKEQYARFVGAVATQRELLRPAVADLKAEHRPAYDVLLDSDSYAALVRVEDGVTDAGAGPVSAAVLKDWDASSAAVLEGLAAAEENAGTGAAAKADAFGWDTLGASGVAVVLGLAGVLLSLLVSVVVGRGLIVELLDLRNSALEVAGRRLPQAMRRLHAGQGVDIDAEAPMRRLAGDELAQVGTALTAVQRAALKAASERAELLSGISGVYVSLARRSQVLLHRQLDLLGVMEQRRHERQDHAELYDLYRVDYLATRMRRHSESLLILSGIAPGRGWRDPIALTDVLRAAVAEIEDGTRVQVWAVPKVSLNGGSVADVIHLLAELVENAAAFSPPSTQVQLRAARLRDGILIEVEDSGFGMNEEAMAEANAKLRSEKVDLLDAKQIGLFVVNRLAERQGLRVELRQSTNGGVAAAVFIPEHLIRDDMPVHHEPSDEGGAPASALIQQRRR
ncbi:MULTISPECIES: nitrate- and nitrite sensing domain-containing protein [Streptomyces]|uniref:histidine kinase n=1 Tax=Streptomyces caniscabiei TaxID=2746961 RepID=A0ABU4MQF9_9ACTN|nr:MULTISPECIES: nitrate- and nitrite sensing domain-containing protein [Streptomyces]MBE4739907.1 sensor histidine kinase [Streptomyces caniscabiei]MBE4758797.1 sensor histidine kinase [Streptomyces caniscabiei]MBE4770102.1 sensor histidine kinase [Streptomyces caniscabiei]MBE4785247.1 sensor histidine kinase [Streptomyces caniscabiei]MBE4797648.1 sensor histidine kinase [Streptomyces caniscabiei]